LLTINSLDFVRNASTILDFNSFLQTPERLAKDHDEVVALAAAKKYRAFVDKTFPTSEVAEKTRHLKSRKGAGKNSCDTYVEIHPSVFCRVQRPGQSKQQQAVERGFVLDLSFYLR